MIKNKWNKENTAQKRIYYVQRFGGGTSSFWKRKHNLRNVVRWLLCGVFIYYEMQISSIKAQLKYRQLSTLECINMTVWIINKNEKNRVK